MKKTLLLFGMGMLAFIGVQAQDAEPVNKVALQALINDAEAWAADETHYILDVATRTDLKAAIIVAKDALTATDNEDLKKAIDALQIAIDEYVIMNAADATVMVQNPQFAGVTKNGTNVPSWVNNGFKGNTSASYTSNRKEPVGINYFVEQWTNSPVGSVKYLGNGDIYQDIANLPAGHYRLTVDAMATNQGDETIATKGVEVYANDNARAVCTQNGIFHSTSVETDLLEGDTLRIGFRFKDTDANWVAFDNVNLYYVGDTAAYHASVDAALLAEAVAEYNVLKDSVANLLKEEQDSLPLGKMALQLRYKELTGDNIDLTSLASVKVALDASSNGTGFAVALRQFYNTNKSWTALVAEVNAAKALLSDEALANGRAELEDALTQVDEMMTQAKGEESDETALSEIATASEGLKKAVSVFRVANASYAYPANVITNGEMNSMDGWTCINGGTANPALHINASGNVEGFSKPFMECWVKNPDTYGAENNAVQTVSTLPDGQPLPVGYYILKASIVAVQQSDVNTPVTGVELRMNDQKAEAHTGNGISEVYTLGFETKTIGEALTIGLYIDAATTANWIAWDNVELQYVGDKAKYDADRVQAELAADIEALQTKVTEVRSLLAKVDAGDANLSEVESALEDADIYLEDPASVTKEELQIALENLNRAAASLMKSGIKPINGEYFDFTNEIANPNFDVDAAGWKLESPSTMVLPGGSDCVNWWFGSSGPESLIQDVNQTLTSMPAGNYIMEVRAAIRLGMTYSIDAYTEENISKSALDYSVYANNDSALIHPFLYEDEAKGLTLEKMLAMTNNYDYSHGNGTLIDNMLKGDNDYYTTYVPFKLEAHGNIKLGFRVEIAGKNGSMPFYDYFKLFYLGDQEMSVEDFVTGVQAPAKLAPATVKRFVGVYNLNGQLLNRTGSVKGLSKGLYIVNGRKVVVK